MENATPEWARTTTAVQRRTAHEYAQETIRRAILRGQLPAGSRLVQSELAAQLEVSTTPVREALRNLTTEGLVVFDAHRGAIVRELSKKELDEIFEIRYALVPLAVRRAVELIDDNELAEAEAIHARMLACEDFGEWLELNREFHAVHFRAAGSPRLESILEALQNASAIYVGRAARHHPDLRRRGEQDHAQIVKAFRERDADAGVEVMLRHIRLPLDLIPADSLS